MNNFTLNIKGDYACFTRPEMKAERVSYDVITPSAARAIFEAIFWKPAIQWVITGIDVLNPIKFIQVRRNELGCVISSHNVEQVMKTGTGNLGVFIEEKRQQRASVLLKDVKYRIYARMEIKPEALVENPSIKMREMFLRRAEKGQCFMQPYLGCREFPAYFSLTTANENNPRIQDSKDLGWMLYDMDYSNKASPIPRFFKAEMENGHISIPLPDSQEIRG